MKVNFKSKQSSRIEADLNSLKKKAKTAAKEASIPKLKSPMEWYLFKSPKRKAVKKQKARSNFRRVFVDKKVSQQSF